MERDSQPIFNILMNKFVVLKPGSSETWPYIFPTRPGKLTYQEGMISCLYLEFIAQDTSIIFQKETLGLEQISYVLVHYMISRIKNSNG
jgi:hypothetical protein